MTDDVTVPEGLTSVEAEQRRKHGEANTAATRASRTYGQILRTNVFSFYNSILFVIGAALLSLGRYSDALVSVGLGLINAVLSSIQELRAKRKLDRLQLLDQAEVTVVRDGVDVRLAPERVVRGDVVHVRAGDQIVVDGPLLSGRGDRLETDESLLTGESDPVVKRVGDDLLSGSFCSGGEGYQLARDVGAASHANKLTTEARVPSSDKTPLQLRMEFVVRLVMVLVALMSITILAQAAMEGFALLRVVQTSAVLSGLVPYGLFFLIAVAYTVGASRIAGRGALIQQVNAVESISNIDVLCTDKTGTLTSGRLRLDSVEPLSGHGEADVRGVLGSLARSGSAPNLTSEALAAALPGKAWTVRQEVPFTSALRWSGVAGEDGTYVLGAPDALAPALSGAPLTERVAEHAGQGLRVLVLARAGDDLRDTRDRPLLPPLTPLALVTLSDELRPDVADTIAGLREQGVTMKVLSGDDPRTVAALARQAGLDSGVPVNGADIDALTDAELDALVDTSAVFGRVAPHQKERIVDALRRGGHYVAMIGDGVNDARALKRAHVGVAMRSGSGVTRDVADIVLVEDSFAALLPAQREGRKIINGIATSMFVFLTRVTTQALVILAVTLLGLGFPYEPTQVGLTLLTVGVPTFFLTLWAPSTPPARDLLGSLARFVLPASVVTAGFSVVVYSYHYLSLVTILGEADTPAFVIEEFEGYTGLAPTDAGFALAGATLGAQTALSTFVTFASFGLLLFLFPPNRLFAAWTRPTSDRRPAIMVALLVAAFFVVLYTPYLSSYFGITDPARPIWTTVVPGLVLWFLALTAAFRWRLMDRMLGLGTLPPPDRSPARTPAEGPTAGP
ncbi:HAD-IC family P-type ATPase [Pseudonocardia sp. KRD-184]|uniref:HAD-IC family P-type ATPase n=1 Tax=Pseudonocardia oceani TaxID=2792013 RepID=A0ABS6U9H8_9PSEU|nr:HAD-IC family P-type ATPase [Pseudonocardia oceani]MBW0089130.1 HAD-IC family P-type ATPase [Pseudonocardia oceani]MBW0095837.1 HAD-IC family P-type ATPase [Pseudonocardia oceani]MBW0108449.1 HAD-IC family P-type ATPase [Pseudonocardia oceani]MBW0122588.1 HAD-IC family P-type ATPase [Pseudonocardia oceani]MBW0128895.1 HAD-IC family P-type ATPase [Pseudonocardia oceani]